MTTSENASRERRDWTLLIFIIPVGIILMLIAGQIAIRLVPIWSVNAGMQSNLDPNQLPMQQGGLLQPLLPSILTPFGWLDTFLTPGSDGYEIISDFIVLDPSSTATTSIPNTPTVVASPTISATDSSPTVIVSPPVTKHPTDDDETSTPITPNATTAVPTTAVPTTAVPTTAVPTTAVPTTAVPTTAVPTTAVPTTAVPTTAVPTTAVPTTAVPTTAVPPTVLPTATLSTPDVPWSITPPPVDIGVDTPPDGTPGEIFAGGYTIVNISGNPITVSSTADGNYDLILHEVIYGPTSIWMDNIIIGVSNSLDGSYYEVFNWGNSVADTNTNVDTNTLLPDPGCIAPDAPECDNRVIQSSDLYNGTGILIDVETAPGGAPPEGTYNYLVIISPLSGALDVAQVDTIIVTKVPIPTP